MGTGKCAEALLFACKLIHNQDSILGLRNATYIAEAQRVKAKDSHAQLFYRKARTAELVAYLGTTSLWGSAALLCGAGQNGLLHYGGWTALKRYRVIVYSLRNT